MFTKRVISLILVFLVGFSIHIREEQIKEIDSFALAKIQSQMKLAEEECASPVIVN